MPGVVVVTGAASGLGAAIADDLTGRGWHVAGWDLNPSAAELCVQVREPEALQRIEQELGPIASLACVTDVPGTAPFVGSEIDEWSAMVRDALTRPFQMIRASQPSLRRSGSGHIVLIGAGWLPSGRRERTAAAAVHGGLVALVKTLGRELGRDGIAVNEIVFDPDNPPPAAVVADTVAYLCGPYAQAVVGQLVTIGSDGEVRP